MTAAASITCPICGRTSWHPLDVAEGWCGACHGATQHPPPAGFRWVLFETPNPLDRFGRMLEERQLEEGAGYTLVADAALLAFGRDELDLDLDRAALLIDAMRRYRHDRWGQPNLELELQRPPADEPEQEPTP